MQALRLHRRLSACLTRTPGIATRVTRLGGSGFFVGGHPPEARLMSTILKCLGLFPLFLFVGPRVGREVWGGKSGEAPPSLSGFVWVWVSPLTYAPLTHHERTTMPMLVTCEDCGYQLPDAQDPAEQTDPDYGVCLECVEIREGQHEVFKWEPITPEPTKPPRCELCNQITKPTEDNDICDECIDVACLYRSPLAFYKGDE